MKIAVTSQNFKNITPHAGKTRRFLVYEVNGDGEPVEAGRLDLDKMMTIHEFRGGDAAHPLDEMDVLITGSAGAGFVQRLHSRGVQVVQTGEKDPIQAIADLRNGQIKPINPHSCNHSHHHRHDEQG
jgi:predicted Fe-Mo cluster-binding NifX family protein